jgi:hypothetical protein
MARRKKEAEVQSPSASFLGPDPTFEEDEVPSEPAPEPKLEAPPPIRTRVREEEFNKCLILFSSEQLGALIEHLSKFKSQLTFELRQEFDKGHLGQVLRNLGGG